MRFVFLGLPGAGKGTQARVLSERLGIQARIYMDRGEYVPDAVMVRMVDERLHEPDASKGYILDGFPRTVPQARALDELLGAAGTPLDAVVQFLIGDVTAVRRI